MNHPGSATAADLYAFGCMAYELLTGELLFDGDDEMALMSGHVAHDGWPEPLAAMANIAAYRDISIVIAACIRREPSYRATAGQARKALLAAWPAVAALTWPLRQHLSINPSAQTA